MRILSRSLRLALVLAPVLALTAAEIRAQEPVEIAPEEAMSHVGELVTVCGTVTSAAFMAASRRQPTFMNFGRPYPQHAFTIVIWGENRLKFARPPLQTFDGQQVCVTGVVAVFKGKPQIIVDEPDQLRLVPSATEGSSSARAGGALTDLEAIFVKALLEALDTGADYGNGEWDEPAVAAMARFQESVDLQPTGDPDPRTLRALAQRTLDLTDDEQERIIRLLLFQLAQRQE